MVNLSLWNVLTRRKTLTSDPDTDTKFNRVLRTFDLTTLGVGATLGVGVYVLAGHVARDQAGPSVILSFAIAALASLFAGICYAEFGARVPKAGSAYIYSYVCIGEFVAFIIGWNLILEYIIGSASVSRGISLYLDTLINDTLKITFLEVAPIDWGFLGPYFDFFAFSIAFIIGVCLAFGFSASTMINNTFTILNLGIVLFVIIAGSFKADLHNWQIDPLEVTEPYLVGKGGFFPFGIEGTMRGAATCFFGFVGFDCIATSGEEVKDPRRAIPRSILFSLLIIFLSYFGVSTVLTLMWPYYLQDEDAPIPFVFQQIKWPIAQWIVTIGGMIGLFASLFGAMFPLPRIIYAMSQDGLIFRQLGHINPRFKTPVTGNIWAAFLTGLMAGVFDLTQLVNMLSIGTLLAYTVVAISITILRFMHSEDSQQELASDLTEHTVLNGSRNRTTCRSVMLQLFNFKRLYIPTQLSGRIVGMILLFYSLCCFGLSLTLMYGYNEAGVLEPWAFSLLGTFLAFLLIFILAISVQPRERTTGVFRVPLVPLIPGISIFVNIYLMLQLDLYTWIRFGVWMGVGIPMYLICICMYRRTAKVQNLDLITSDQTSFQNGKITIHTEDNPRIINGTLPTDREDSLSIPIESKNLEEIRTSEANIETIEIHPKTPSPKQYLDEIVPAAKVADSHIEIKNSNGKTFFIEDISVKESLELQEEEDAKSVIAMLDNVLQVEDSIEYHDFIRKASIDSEFIPSFVETSTIAMVHNSHDSFKEEENESVIQTVNNSDYLKYEDKIEHNEENLKTKENEEMFEEDIIERNKHEESGVSQVENELENNETNDLDFIEKTTEETLENSNLENTTTMQRLSSKSSEKSYDENAVHSETFKEKLSRLLAQVTPLKTIRPNPPEAINKMISMSGTQTPILSKMKPSKSEPDFANIIADEHSEALLKTNSNQKIQDNRSEIPKPPKFDPILYKTVGTRQHNQPKERPKLDEFLQNVSKDPSIENISTSIFTETTSSTPSPKQSPIPFKKRLENLLKMGPSHKVTTKLPKPILKSSNQQPVSNDFTTKDNKKITTDNEVIPQPNISSSDEQYNKQIIAVLKSISKQTNSEKIVSQKPIITHRSKTIEEARKNLRHVHVN